MPKWINENLFALVTLLGGTALNLILVGSAYSTIRADVNQTIIRVKTLEDQRGDETRWRVTQVESRADKAEQVNVKLVEKLDHLTLMIERIDQRTIKP